jgi:quinohemoprotein ethanol dehydrogenase
MNKGRLLAWDPARQEERWSVEHFGPWNGGVLSTAGDIVFQGTSDAHFAAFDAKNGRELWKFFTQTGVVAAPVAYEIDGEQYIAVATGWGGAYALIGGGVIPTGSEAKVGRILAFKLGAKGELPPANIPQQAMTPPPPSMASAEKIAAGAVAYAATCTVCHGEHAVSSGLVPNLRYSPVLSDATLWKSIVREGARASLGMGNFGAMIDDETSEAIRAYVIAEANSGRDAAYYARIAGTEKRP